MDDTTWLAERDALTTALVRGVARQPVTLPMPFAGVGEDQQHLALLAALAARQRFDLPVGPDQLVPQPVIHDDVTPVTGVLRTELVRYFTRQSRAALPMAVTRVFSALKARDLHVHPFDYMAMRSVIQPHTAMLVDTAFLRWSRRGAKKADQGALKATVENWLDFPISARCNFITDLHSDDPTKTRDLLSEHLTGETAANRAKLIGCLSDALTPDDRAFLEGFEQDRSKNVKEVVTDLLSRLPGTTQNKVRLDEAQSRLVVKKAKLLGTKVVTVDKPMHIKGYELDRWYQATFANLSPEQLISAHEISIGEFIKGLKDASLAFYCFEHCVRSNNVAQAKRFLGAFEADAHQWIDRSTLQSQHLTDEMSDLCWSVLIERVKKNSLWSWCEQVIHNTAVLSRPMPDSFAQKLLNDKQLKAGLPTLEEREHQHDGALLDVLVCLLPSSCFDALNSRLEGVSPLSAAPARQLMNLISLAENSISLKPST